MRLPLTSPLTTPLSVVSFGWYTTLPVKVWRWSRMFGPLSKSRFVGSDRPASPCTDSVPVIGALSSLLPSV